MIKREIPIIVSSDPDNGASTVSADGSRYDVYFGESINIPYEAENVMVTVLESTVWWVTPNVKTGVNDKMYITYDDGGGPVAYNITIPQGLYGVVGLNSAISTALANAGAPTSPASLISLSGDASTQKTQITANYDDITINFTQTDTFREILGFNSVTLGPNGSSPFTWTSNVTASFNQVNYYLLHGDLVDKGIRVNNKFNQNLAQVLIDVAPGSQIISRPRHPPRLHANRLKGTKRTSAAFWLTDDQNRAVETNGEPWTMRLVIEYYDPIK